MNVVINPYHRSVAIDGVEVRQKVLPFPDYLNHLASITCEYDADTQTITDVANVHRYTSHFIEKEYYYKHLPEFVDWFYAEQKAQKAQEADDQGFGKVQVGEDVLDAKVDGDVLTLLAKDDVTLTADPETNTVVIGNNPVSALAVDSLDTVPENLKENTIVFIKQDNTYVPYNKKFGILNQILLGGLPIANKQSLGLVKIGAGLTVANGLLSVTTYNTTNVKSLKGDVFAEEYGQIGFSQTLDYVHMNAVVVDGWYIINETTMSTENGLPSDITKQAVLRVNATLNSVYQTLFVDGTKCFNRISLDAGISWDEWQSVSGAVASKDKVGVVKIGNGLQITEDGNLSLSPKISVFGYVGEFRNFYEQSPPQGWAVRDGAVLQNADVDYPELWATLQLEANAWKCKTAEEWASLSEAAGGVGGVPFFVLDTEAKTIKLPDTRGDYERGAGSDFLPNVGDWHGDAVRDVRGVVGFVDTTTVTPSGCFAKVTNRSNWGMSSGAGSSSGQVNFVLGNAVPTADEARTRAFAVLPCVCIKSSFYS